MLLQPNLIFEVTQHFDQLGMNSILRRLLLGHVYTIKMTTNKGKSHGDECGMYTNPHNVVNFIRVMFISAKILYKSVWSHAKLKATVPYRVHGAGNRLQLSSDSSVLFLVFCGFLSKGATPRPVRASILADQTLCLTVLVGGALYRDCN
jgi:hypothetical protein